jgi:hypothetical protein
MEMRPMLTVRFLVEDWAWTVQLTKLKIYSYENITSTSWSSTLSSRSRRPRNRHMVGERSKS